MKKVFKKVATSALAATLVLPAGIAGAATKFPDVNPNTVTPDVQQAIEALAEQGIIQGFPDGTFGPNKSITRAQFAKILAQVKGLQPNPAAAAQFTDVKDPEQRGWVGALVEAGLTTGTTPTTYSPNRPIQRDQAATFLVRALGLEEVAKELDLTPTTTDGARINASHKANVGLLEKIGLVKGYPNGAYGPGDPFKRQQAANLLYKVQQEGDTYVAAAHALLNKVEVVYNDNGTLTIKGSIKGAAKVDVVVREAEAATTQAAGDVLFEQKGVEAKDGVFEVTTSFIGNKDVTVSVTAYDANGNVITTLEQKAQAPQGEVKGYTEAPDLIAVRADGKYVYFTFDEPIKDIEEDTAFYVISFANSKTPARADKVKLQNDKVTVRAEFYNPGVPATAVLAGVDKGAVSDEDGNENIERALPLNNVKLAGATGGPDLKSVRIGNFAANKDDNNTPDKAKEFTVEYEFDEDVYEDYNNPANDIAANKFVLYLKDGTKLVGKEVTKAKGNSVEVKFSITVTQDAYGNLTVTSDAYGGNKIPYKSAGRYKTEIDRDDVALAAVEAGAVRDNHDAHTENGNAAKGRAYNPLTVVDARTKVSATYLRNAEIDFEDGEVTFIFNRDVEGIISKDDADKFFLVTVAGGGPEGKSMLDFKNNVNASMEIDGRKVTFELDDNSNVLAAVVGVAVGEINIEKTKEQERVVPGYVGIERSFNAGTPFGPTLRSSDVEYDASDELLTITLNFSEEVETTDGLDSNPEDFILLYNAEGVEVDYEVSDVEADDEEVKIEIEIEEDELEEVVVIVIKYGAFKSAADYRNGLVSHTTIELPY